MNKTCARCCKVVYPTEELKCLDKTWHKTCFRCHECGMTLNMKSYKGYNKYPYCEAHIPKAKATAIADTPELKRIAENTKLQSNVLYHADFEKQKGKFTQVADDPETLRIKQNTKFISNVAYHGDLEKKAAMEKQREVAEVAENRENEYEYFSETLAAEQISQYQQKSQNQQQQNEAQIVPQSHFQQVHKQNIQTAKIIQSPQTAVQKNCQILQKQQPQQRNQQLYNKQSLPKASQMNMQHLFSYPNTNALNKQTTSHNNCSDLRSSIFQNSHQSSGSHSLQQDSGRYFDSYDNYTQSPFDAQKPYKYNNNNARSNSQNNYQYQHQNNHLNDAEYISNYEQTCYDTNSVPLILDNGSSNSGIGKIADYDPLSDGPRNIPTTPRPSATLIYSSDRGPASNTSHSRKIGSGIENDSNKGVYSSIADQLNIQNQYYHNIQVGLENSNHQQQKRNMRVYRALYDYTAQDTDEVSFAEGDLIFEVESTDSGWMTGKVDRTGKTGMVPANYVEPALI